MKQGEIVCVKTTGELVIVLETLDGGQVTVRRARETRDGIDHREDLFNEFELESPQNHLNRKAEAYMLNLQMQKSVIGKKVKELEREVQEEETGTIFDRLKVN